MRAKNLEELQIWQRARRFAEAVFETSRTGPFERDRRLCEQLNDAADSVVANIAEGFGQPTDRAFARYLSISKGAALEVKSHLVVALGRRYISPETCQPLVEEGTEIVRMIAAFIRYLHRSDWKDRF